MFIRTCVRFAIVFAVLAAFAIAVPASAQGIGFSFGGNSKHKDDHHEKHGEHDRRGDDEHRGGITFGGSNAKQFKAIIGEGDKHSDDASHARRHRSEFRRDHSHDSHDWHDWHSGRHHRGHHDSHGWFIEFGGLRPFSAGWYDEHPNAWRHHHGHRHDDDAWKVATVAGVLGWLGWGHDGPVVIHDGPVGGSVVVDPDRPGDWMTLGAYTLVTGPGDAGTRLLELAVDKHGFLGGNYYDMISGASYNVTGRIDHDTRIAKWSLESNQRLSFSAPLEELTQPQGVVKVKFPSGRQDRWRLVRVEDGGK